MSQNPDKPAAKPPIAREKAYIPVSIRTSAEGSPCWGRITAITPESVDLMSRFEFRKGKMLALDFELDGGKMEEIRCSVTGALRDDCGYFHYETAFADRNQRDAVLAVLIRLNAGTQTGSKTSR